MSYRLQVTGCVLLMLALAGVPGVWLLDVSSNPRVIPTVLTVWTITAPVAIGLLPVTLEFGSRMRLSRNDLARAVQTLSAQIDATWMTLLDRGTPRIDLSATDDDAQVVPADRMLREWVDAPHTHGVLLGDRGAGKSLLLTSLALRLLDDRSRGDENQPIPVYLPLSQWLSQNRDLRDWAITAFADNALITRDLARRLVDTAQVVLLLDGLDELRVGATGTNSMERLLVELRTWDRDFRPPRFLLACRTDVWEVLPVTLTNEMPTIRLLPLTARDIEGAVHSVQPSTALTTEILRRVRRRSVNTLALLRSPWRLQVMLSLAATNAASSEEFASWLGSRALEAAALRRYVELRLSAPGCSR